MTSAPQPPGPMRYILIGCGILTGLFILGMGGCGAIFYFVYRGTEPVADLGAEYLRKSPKIRDEFGTDTAVRRNRMGWNVNVVNDGGHAHFTYSLQGNLGSGQGVVWLRRSAGKWSVVGARATPAGRTSVTIGKPPPEHRIDLDD